MKTKHCVMGKHEAPLSDFGPNKKTKDGLTCSCKVCKRERYQKWNRGRHEQNRKTRDEYKFRISSFHAMFKAARLGGKDCFEALASAVTGSSDDVFRTLPEGSVERWVEFNRERFGK